MLYGFSKESIHAATWPLGDIFIRELSLSEYPEEIAKEAGVDMPVAYGIAYEVTKRIFLRFPEYFTDAEALMRQWETQKAAPPVSLEEAKRKVLELEPWLLEQDEDDESETAAKTDVVKLPLLRAVGDYPNIGNQQITRERIRIEGQREPVRPSLANWVKAYRNELGVGYHEPVARAKFLFDSENGKKLSSEERERLNVIIRSIEENEPVEIDAGRAEILFPEARISDRKAAPKPVAPPRPSAPQATPIRPVVPAGTEVLLRPAPPATPVRRPIPPIGDGNRIARTPRASSVSAGASQATSPLGGTLSYSSGHSLPGERKQDGKGFSIRYGRAASGPTDPKPAPPHSDGGRVVDLRGE